MTRKLDSAMYIESDYLFDKNKTKQNNNNNNNKKKSNTDNSHLESSYPKGETDFGLSAARNMYRYSNDFECNLQ